MTRAKPIAADPDAQAAWLAEHEVNICDQEDDGGGGVIPVEPIGNDFGVTSQCAVRTSTGQTGILEVQNIFGAFLHYVFHPFGGSPSIHIDLSDFEPCEQEPTVIGIENTSFCSIRDADGVTGHIEIIRAEDGTLTEYIFHPFGADPVSLGMSLVGYSPCQNKEYTPTDCIVIDVTSPFCGQTTFECQASLGLAFIFNHETFQYEDIEVSKVGKNDPDQNLCKRPFVCEFPADGADATIDNASVIAALSGALFPGTTLPADDAASVYLHDFSATLTHQGDEAEGGFIATSCQAVATDVETGKTKDLEPGGDYPLSVDPGQDVPPFSIVVTDGSNLVVCGSVSVAKAKDGTAVPKA